MLRLNKQWSGGKSSGDKDSTIQTVKERLLRQAYQLQIEQEEIAKEFKEAEQCEKLLQALKKQHADRNHTPVRTSASAAELRELLEAKKRESQELELQLFHSRMSRY